MTYSYDELNRQTSITDSIGTLSTMSYDADSNILSQTDGNGNVSGFSYNDLHQQTAKTLPLNRSHSYSYTIFGEMLTDTGPNGTITNSINQLGRTYQTTGPDNLNLQFVYDLNGNLTNQTDSRNVETVFTINELNQTTAQTTSGFVSSMSYDTVGNVLTATDYRGIVSTSVYDKENRLTQFSRDTQIQSKTTYNSAGLASVVEDANGNRTINEYNPQYYKTRMILPESQIVEYSPNAFGDIEFQDNPGANDITRVYDARRRLLSETNGAGEITQYEYDGNNNRTAVIKPKGNRIEYTFDAANRLTSIKNVDEEILTQYAYDNRDNLISITDAENKVTTFEFDNSNRKTKKIYPDLQVVTYGYDANGNLDSVGLPNGTNMNYIYDDLNRQIQQNYQSPSDQIIVDFILDGNGNITKATENYNNEISSIDTQFDNLDRLTVVTDHHGNSLQFSYDANGNRTVLHDTKNNQSSTYTYDDLNRLSQAVVAGTGAFDYVYNSSGLLQEVSNGINGISQFAYDNANRIDTIVKIQSGVPIASFDYDYDTNGNRTQVTQSNLNTNEVITYSYDQADRMTQVVYPDMTVTYGLDKVGNRVNESSDNGISTTSKTYSYNNRDQITSITDTNGLSVSYSYDEAGNRTQKNQNGSITQFAYTPRQRIETISQESNTTSFKYDYLGNRIEKNNNGQTKLYTYDGTSLLYETNTLGNVLAKYHYGSDRILAETRNGQNSYIFHDALRTPIAITNQDGSIQNRLDYDAWGNLKGESSTSEHPFGFTGYQHDDETGLYYAKARYYDPVEGVFLREDPLFGDVNTPPSLHRYNYAFNNPTAWIDPTGKANDTSHYYEAFLIAKLVGLNEGQMYAYAIGAQIGDEFKHHDAIENSENYILSKGLFPYSLAVLNNCGAHALCDTQPDKVRDAVSEYTLNFAQNYAEIGTADHTHTDSYYHIKASTLGTDNEELHTGIIGHLLELKKTDKAFLYHESKRKKAFKARAWLLYEYSLQQGTQTMSRDTFREQLNDMLADLDQQNEELHRQNENFVEETSMFRDEDFITDRDEFRSMDKLLAKHGIYGVSFTATHDVDHNIEKLLYGYGWDKLKKIAIELDPDIDTQLLDITQLENLVKWINAKFDNAQYKSKAYIYSKVKEKENKEDIVTEDSDKPGIEEISK